MSIWLSEAEIKALPTGAAYDKVKAAASALVAASGDIGNQDSKHDTNTLAAALVAAKDGNAAMKAKVVAACNAVIGTESGNGPLAAARNLPCYVIAADIVGHRAQPFVDWVAAMRTKNLGTFGGVSSIKQSQETRPNNFGTHASSALVCANLFVGDGTSLDRAVKVLRGWLGDRAQYTGFKFGDLTWQSDQAKPVGINPAGAKIQGHSVDGVVPDDQRRAGGFKWPPPCENYVKEGLGPVAVALMALKRNGYPDCQLWSDKALLRAITWLYSTADGKSACVCGGDDTWLPWVVNALYPDAKVPTASANPGKGMAWTDFTHPAGTTVPDEPPPPPPPPPDCSDQLAALTAAKDAYAVAASKVAQAQAAYDHCIDPNTP